MWLRLWYNCSPSSGDPSQPLLGESQNRDVIDPLGWQECCPRKIRGAGGHNLGKGSASPPLRLIVPFQTTTIGEQFKVTATR